MNQLHWTTDFLLSKGVRADLVEWIALGIDVVLIALVSLVADFLARRILS